MAAVDTAETARATFTRMDQSTKGEWDIIMSNLIHHAQDTVADRILGQLSYMRGDHGGFAVDRLTHSLQTAALAEEDSKDEEYILCALLHDIGDILAPFNHADLAAAVLKPYVSEANYWMVKHHGILQGYFFWHLIGLDRDAHKALAHHEHYGRTMEFCAKYDQLAFDPDRVTPDLAYYEPLIRDTFGPKSDLSGLV